MIDLSGTPAEITFTIEVKRAATGLTEKYQLVGHVVPQPETNVGEADDSQSRDISA